MASGLFRVETVSRLVRVWPLMPSGFILSGKYCLMVVKHDTKNFSCSTNNGPWHQSCKSFRYLTCSPSCLYSFLNLNFSVTRTVLFETTHANVNGVERRVPSCYLSNLFALGGSGVLTITETALICTYNRCAWRKLYIKRECSLIWAWKGI